MLKVAKQSFRRAARANVTLRTSTQLSVVSARLTSARRPLSKLYVMSTPAKDAAAEASSQTAKPAASTPTAASTAPPSASARPAATAQTGESSVKATASSQAGANSGADQKAKQQQSQPPPPPAGPGAAAFMDRAGWILLLLAIFGIGYMRPRYAQSNDEQ